MTLNPKHFQFPSPEDIEKAKWSGNPPTTQGMYLWRAGPGYAIFKVEVYQWVSRNKFSCYQFDTQHSCCYVEHIGGQWALLKPKESQEISIPVEKLKQSIRKILTDEMNSFREDLEHRLSHDIMLEFKKNTNNS